MSFKDFGEAVVRFFLFILRVIVAVVQFALSYVIITNIFKIIHENHPTFFKNYTLVGEPDIGLMIFCIALLAGVCFIKLKCIYKDFMEFHTALIFVEMLLSPIRFLLGIIKYIFVIFFHFETAYETDFIDGIIPKIIVYVLEVSPPDDFSDTSPLGNLLTQLLVLLPIAALSSFCFYALFIPSVLTKYLGIEVNILIRFFAFYGLTMVTMFYVDLRKMESAVRYWDSTFVYENRYTNKRVKVDRDRYYVNESEAYDSGWERTSGGNTWLPTGTFYLFYCLSPILVFLQAIGVVFAFISMFTRHIYSCFGNSDLGEDIPLRGIQKIIYFLFSFIIC